jgi:hypothetical protein
MKHILQVVLCGYLPALLSYHIAAYGAGSQVIAAGLYAAAAAS